MFESIEEKIIEELIKSRLKTQADLNSFKKRVSKKYKVPCQSNIELLKVYHKLVENKSIKRVKILENLLKTRPIRSLSGIVNISVLTKPYPCPGKCLYCPLEKGIPKSYISGEPAVERAKALNFDPYLQTQRRIEMLENQGHPTDKIELRTIGGTWSYYPKNYQVWFIKECFRSCNESKRINLPWLNNASDFILKGELKKEQKLNKKAKHRIVGLSIETRPDFIDEKEIKWLRKLGVTMVELGIQSIYDDVLRLNRRGHGVKEIIEATKLLKNAGFKVLYQMMPNLPGSNPKKDEKMFEELFQNPDFQPDLLKIYPCALLKETPLYNWYLKGKYKPYSEKTLINLIKKIKKKIPCHVRIQRIVRDIPSQDIVEGGAKISNLRQVLAGLMKKEGWQCRCIRCREVKEKYNPKEKVYLFRQDYEASGGREIFLSFENKDQTRLFSLLRLRIPSRPFLSILKDAAIIREIHTYGELVPIGKMKTAPQHRGLGKKLIKEAEKITKKEFRLRKLAVIAAIGTRHYFHQLGYQLKETYMVKKFN